MKPKVLIANPKITDKTKKNTIHLSVNLSLYTMKSRAEAIAIRNAPIHELKNTEAIISTNVLRNWNLYAFLSLFTHRLINKKIPATSEIRFPTIILNGKIILLFLFLIYSYNFSKLLYRQKRIFKKK